MTTGDGATADWIPLSDPQPALWLADRLREGMPPPAVSSVVPVGYPAYVEVSLRLDEEPSPMMRVWDVLLAHTDLQQIGYWAIWEGWPLMHSIPGGPTLGIPDDFTLYVFEHPLADARDRLRITDGDETLWWPLSRTWVYARPVDSDALYIACDQAVAEALLSSGLEGARQVEPADAIMDDVGGAETH